jgi:signal transduction histidine kinase
VSQPRPAGDTARRIAGFDWSATPLGARESWPQSLRTIIDILLSSRYAMWMLWGPEMTFLCNDAYRPTLGMKDPWALGTPAPRVWAEIWPEIGPRIETVLTTGNSTYDEGLMLFLERSGFREETYHTFSYSPLRDDQGDISGMLCVVTEETDRFIGERQVETLRDVAAALSRTKTEEEVRETLAVQLAANPKDLPYTLLYVYDEAGAANLAGSSGISHDDPLAVARIPAGVDVPWPAAAMLAEAESRFVPQPSGAPCGFWETPSEFAVLAPIRQQGHETPAGFLVASVNPFRRYAVYSGFIDLLAGQIAAALGNARAYEAERRRAEALAEIDRAKTTFFSNVSHELRTPLTLMLSPVEELLSRASADATEREMLELVHRNGMRLQRLVNTLLDFSRIEAGRMDAHFEPIDLPLVTGELAANFRSAMEKAGLRFQV